MSMTTSRLQRPEAAGGSMGLRGFLMGSPASTTHRACGEKGGGPCEINPATPMRLQDRPASPACQCGRGEPCGGLRACHALTRTALACDLPHPAPCYRPPHSGAEARIKED